MAIRQSEEARDLSRASNSSSRDTSRRVTTLSGHDSLAVLVKPRTYFSHHFDRPSLERIEGRRILSVAVEEYVSFCQNRIDDPGEICTVSSESTMNGKLRP